jgi:hypothetical protein
MTCNISQEQFPWGDYFRFVHTAKLFKKLVKKKVNEIHTENLFQL